jgi:predicted DCC family thiol-disulfide oxidoreductase YuxK
MCSTHPIILFDGHCNLCSGVVRFIINRDPSVRFRFAAMQSEAGGKLLHEHGLDRSAMQTVYVIDGDGEVYGRSTAVLEIVRRLSGLWPVFYVLRIIPVGVRDICYGIVSRYRYRIFGRQEACMVPNENMRDRFLA